MGVEAKSPPVRTLLQELWADQGDRVSQQYTGANSIVSSLLRQGRMSSLMMFERSWTGISRAYQASFEDAKRQESIELLLGLHAELSSELPCFKERPRLTSNAQTEATASRDA